MNKKLMGLILAVIAVNCNAACTQAQVVKVLPHPEVPQAVQAQRKAAGKPVNWQYENEQQWLVSSITSDIAEMLCFAKFKDRKDPVFAAGEVEVVANTLDLNAGSYEIAVIDAPAKIKTSSKLSITDYIWSTKTYEPFTRSLLDELALSAGTVSAAPEGFIATLANGDMEALISENERVSKELTERPLDAGLHEQAAMLLTKFNIEEVAGRYTEDRPQLSRGCAHLTIARALQKGSLGTLGQLAEVSLELMSVRDGMVIKRLAALEEELKDPIAKSWVRAMQIRATHDIRLFDEKNHTDVEESQYVMRFANDRSPDKMIEYVGKLKKKPSMLLLRILSTNNGSVEGGHMLMSQVVPAELNFFVVDFKAYKKQAPADPAALMEELNRTPKRCLSTSADGKSTLNVISWDDIAAFHCRHILSATCNEYSFLEYMYGVPEEAKQSLERTKKLLANVYLRPLAMLAFRVEHEDKTYTIKGCREIMENYPQLVTSVCWGQAIANAKEAKSPESAVPAEKWFDPALPMGTAYFFHSRSEFPNYKKDLATLTKLREYCPYFYELDQAWAEAKFGPHPNDEQYAEAFEPILPFSLQALQVVATGAIPNPEKFLPLEERAAAMEPAVNFNLGAYCVLHNRPEQAAKYFEKAIESSDNSVMASNQADWLIKYRLAHGQKDKAKELADFCGEVYSQMGLESLAAYQELTGDLAAAEQTHKNVIERYDSKTAYLGFLLRNAEKDKRYAQESSVLLKEFYPQGMKKVSLASFTAAPTDGVLVTDEDMFADTSPLKKGVVMVALNGYKIDNMKQLYVARELTKNDKINVIYWDGKKYAETVKQLVHDHMLRIQISENAPAK
ncbi:MAG: hypothetical protein JSS86_12960 [Cyanobacteria bacterium SZAS LIN-2]|nr:hypothetical protein [Cyanobacteria bacterium SZAS LIN-2]